MTAVHPDVERMRATLPDLVDDVALLVRAESPSSDLEACRATAALLADLVERRLEVEAEPIEVDGRVHLRCRVGDPRRRPVLILGHYDTVWHSGTIDRLPWRAEPDDSGELILRGPGAFDMKAGLVQALWAVRSADPGLPVTLLLTGDEEIGSPTSRELIEDEARRSCAALVLEGSADGGRLKSGRKGVSQYVVEARGRAAHAGLEPENGINAAVEIAAQLIRLEQLPRGTGTTIVPTLLAAGSAANTVPASGSLTLDVRAWTGQEQQAVDDAVRGLRPVDPRCEIHVSGGVNRPPLESAASQRLADLAAQLHRHLLGTDLGAVAVGGASDGNFTAGIGVPTLDGLGAVGGGAHADSEHVVAGRLADRAVLVAHLVRELVS